MGVIGNEENLNLRMGSGGRTYSNRLAHIEQSTAHMDEAPALLRFAKCLLSKAAAETIYHDQREQVTVVHRLEEGVPRVVL